MRMAATESTVARCGSINGEPHGLFNVGPDSTTMSGRSSCLISAAEPRLAADIPGSWLSLGVNQPAAAALFFAVSKYSTIKPSGFLAIRLRPAGVSCGAPGIATPCLSPTKRSQPPTSRLSMSLAHVAPGRAPCRHFVETCRSLTAERWRSLQPFHARPQERAQFCDRDAPRQKSSARKSSKPAKPGQQVIIYRLRPLLLSPVAAAWKQVKPP
ncbi:hypothetical protein P3T21_006845 [Paraburkholderia sp. GAS334]